MRLKYSVDSRNQLIIKTPKSKTPLKPRGTFQINKKNQLEYWLNEPSDWRKLYGLPRKIVFEGKWRLDDNHDLELRLNKTRQQDEGSRLALKGDIISADKNTLVFEIITQRGSAQREPPLFSFRILKLSGTWQADAHNRLVFCVEKKAFPDELVFKLSWQVNKNQQIEYSYTRTNLSTRSKTAQTILFKGYWKIDAERKLAYVMSHGLDSRFDFRAQLESPQIRAQEGAIKYRIGIGFRRPRAINYTLLTLYGEWKFGRGLKLIFRMDYGKGNVREMEFGAEAGVSGNKFLFMLTGQKGEPLGIALTYSFGLLNSLEPHAFIRLKSRQKELGIDAGITLPF